MDWGCEWSHAQKRWAGILSDFEKAVSWDLNFDGASWDSNLVEASPVVCCGVWARVFGSDETVSIIKIVSLSPRVKYQGKESSKSSANNTWTMVAD